jgi:antitoxin (DNA-binding transcriptional repressor) of toxin-antitoxin stability system
MAVIIGLKDLRLNVDSYAKQVALGKSFVVVKQSKPIFKIVPVDEDGEFETVIDFTEIKKGGVSVKDIDRSIRESLKDYKDGRSFGPFDNHKDLIASLHKESKKLKGKK